MEMTLEQIQASTRGLFAEMLGVEFLETTPELVRARILVGERHCTMPGLMHGGAVMALADTLGAYGTVLNLPPGAGTTTVESKTNFFSKVPSGAHVIAECRPLHRGRRTMVWETKVMTEAGKLAATVTQTQIVLAAEQSPQDALAALFAEGATNDHQALLAKLERSGGALYRRWAEAETNEEVKAGLLAAADREDENAVVLEELLASRAGGSAD
jgi:1,4-dihydroxy-2-naphthoyl-CoA hydrolase